MLVRWVQAGSLALMLASPASAQSAKSVKIGVINDQSGVYSEHGGVGSIWAAKRAAEDFGAAAKGITVEQHAPKGAAADAIVRVAEESDADLIVIGSVGMQGAKRIFGSVPNKVSHRTPCDLLIVQTAER